MADSPSLKASPLFTNAQTKFAAAKNDQALFSAIVNAPFEDKLTAATLSLGIVVLLLVNKKTNMIDRVALSDTEPAKGAVTISEKPFKTIKIPIDYTANAIAKAIQTNESQKVTDWKYLFIPAMSPEGGRFNQAGAGIGCSVVCPIKVRDGGALIFSYYQEPDKIGRLQHDFMKRYTTLVSKYL